MISQVRSLESAHDEIQCEVLLNWIYGLSDTDIRVFMTLAERATPTKIDDLTEAVDRDRGTIFRSLQGLRECGFVKRKKVTYENGGYYHEYCLTDIDTNCKEMLVKIETYRDELNSLITEFQDKYGAKIN